VRRAACQAGAVTGSTPADLAVTFRSLGRRLREAIGDGSEASVSGLVGELRSQVDAAGAVLGLPGGAGADEVADAILARRPEDWDQTSLAELRQQALEIGGTLRRIATATETDVDR
jgi:hypothetical protein